jgi:hypothetical protein
MIYVDLPSKGVGFKITYIITVYSTGIVPATEKDRTSSVVGISWNAWFFEIGLYHCVSLRDELERNDVSNFGSYIVRVV